MKLKLVNNVDFPKDLDVGYEPVWDAFLKMRALQQLRASGNAEAALQDCFRMLINQTGGHIKLLNKPSDFVSLQLPVKQLKEVLRKGSLLNNTVVTTHKKHLEYTASKAVCAAFAIRYHGVVVLKPQRFGMDHIVGRMQHLLFKNVPAVLMGTLPNGKPRKFKKASSLLPQDFFEVYSSDVLSVSLSRTEKELVLRYTVKVQNAVPLYARLDFQLKELWRKSITGVIK